MLRALAAAAAVAAAAVLAACTTDSNPVREIVSAAGLRPATAPAPEFVVRSRPEKLDYLPVGTSAPQRATPARTADEVKAAEAELEAVRKANEAAAEAARQNAPTPPEPVRVPVRPRPGRAP